MLFSLRSRNGYFGEVDHNFYNARSKSENNVYENNCKIRSIATDIWNMRHGWGGHIGLHTDLDFTGDGIPDAAFVLDDDRPGTHGGNNQGIIPVASLARIDQLLDDGNLATGIVRRQQA